MEEYIFHEILCLQKFTKNISYTLKAKNDSNRQVLVQDLKLMFVAQHKIQVDTARWLTHKLYFIKNDKHTIFTRDAYPIYYRKIGVKFRSKRSRALHFIQRIRLPHRLVSSEDGIVRERQTWWLQIREYHPRH